MKINRSTIGRYFKAMETDSLIFFIDFHATDSRRVKMYEKYKGKLDLLSNDITTNQTMLDILIRKSYLWAHPKLNGHEKVIEKNNLH